MRHGEAPFRAADVGDLLRPNLVELARKGVFLPLRALAIARQVVHAARGP